MRFVALDLGTNVGWAAGDFSQGVTGHVYFGTQNFKPGRFEGGGMRFLRFQRWLQEMHSLEPIGWLTFEEVRGHKGTDAAHIYGGFLASLTAFCEERSIPYQGVPVGTIKAFWTGKGNAGKDEMIKVAAQRGFDMKDNDDNKADALALFHWMTCNASTSSSNQRPAPNERRVRRVPLVDL